MKYIPTRFNILGSYTSNFPNLPSELIPSDTTIDAYVDSYCGSDIFGDGSPEKPYKTAFKAYDTTSHSLYNQLPIIVLRGYFKIDFDDSNVLWVGDDKNTVIEYPSNNGKSGVYTNLTVKGYFKRQQGVTQTYMTNLNAERDTQISAGNKGYYGVIDLRVNKPITELLGGYWYCVVLGNRFSGGCHYSVLKGQGVDVGHSNDCMFTADSTFLVNNVDTSYLSARGNYSTDAEYTEYIKSQTGYNNLFYSNKRNFVTRYTFDEIFIYDEDNLSFSLTDIGMQLAKQYPEIMGWMVKGKVVTITENSDGVKECFDANTASGAISVDDDSILIDETRTSGYIASKVIKLNRTTQAINGLVSGLRRQFNDFSTTYEIRKTSSENIYISNSLYTVTANKSGYWVTDASATNVSTFFLNGNEVAFGADEIIYLAEGDTLQANTGKYFYLFSVIQPNNIVAFYLRGTNKYKSTISSGTLTANKTYLAINGSATLSIGGNTRTLIEGESIDSDGTEELTSGELAVIFDSTDPWFIIESNSDKFGVGLYNGYSGYEKPTLNNANGSNVTYSDIRGNNIYLTKSVKLPSRYDTRTSNGISFRYVQLKLEYYHGVVNM